MRGAICGPKRFALEFLGFGLKQGRACVFAGTFFAVLFLSGKISLVPIARYDFLLFFALVFQGVLWWTKIETTMRSKLSAFFIF
jgi:uncharacterized membrane protein YoaT (DUF817 family)